MNKTLFNSMVEVTKPFGIDPYFTYAVGTVESNNIPFLSNGSPIVRFEKHVFLRQLKKHKAPMSMIDRANKLKGSNFNTLVSAMSIEDKIAAMSTVESALELDDYCAMLATSYGIFQIMGFNHKSAGYDTVSSFVEAMVFSLVNPDSTFSVTDAITLPTDVTTGLFSAELTTIADSASLATGKGYKLGITTSFTDNNMTITISSITRVSEAIDPF